MEIISGKYALLNKIGEGGQGKVYLAKHINTEFGLDKQVVIKFFPKNESTKKYFLNEVKILSRMNHANIISIIDVGETNEEYFLVLEYINGIDLKTFCEKSIVKNIRIESKILIHIFRQVYNAIKYAHLHDKGVILHKDISPQNIIITEDGRVKLIDFGISELSNDEHCLPSNGKVRFVPPKVTSGVQRYNESSDLYEIAESIKYTCEILDINLGENLDWIYEKLLDRSISDELISNYFHKVDTVSSNDFSKTTKQIIDNKYIVDKTEVTIDSFNESKSKNYLLFFRNTIYLILCITIIFIIMIYKPWSNKDFYSIRFLFISNVNKDYEASYPKKSTENLVKDANTINDKSCDLYCSYSMFFISKTLPELTKSKSEKTISNISNEYLNISARFKRQENLCSRTESCRELSRIAKEIDNEVFYSKSLNKNSNFTERLINNQNITFNKYINDFRNSFDPIKEKLFFDGNYIYNGRGDLKKPKYSHIGNYSISNTKLDINEENCKVLNDFYFLMHSKKNEISFNLILVDSSVSYSENLGFPTLNFNNYKQKICTYTRKIENGTLEHFKIWTPEK